MLSPTRLARKSDHEKSRAQDSTSFVEGPVGLEPTTPCLKGRCSNQLSYGPLCVLYYIGYMTTK